MCKQYNNEIKFHENFVLKEFPNSFETEDMSKFRKILNKITRTSLTWLLVYSSVFSNFYLVYSNFSNIYRTGSVIIVRKVRIILLEIIENLPNFAHMLSFGTVREFLKDKIFPCSAGDINFPLSETIRFVFSFELNLYIHITLYNVCTLKCTVRISGLSWNVNTTCIVSNSEIVYFDTRGQNGRLAHCIFTRAVTEWPVWPHVSNHIFRYKFMRTRVGSPFTDIENAP